MKGWASPRLVGHHFGFPTVNAALVAELMVLAVIVTVVLDTEHAA